MVLGTRPEAIKLAPVARALHDAGRDLRLIHTGQHPLPEWQRAPFPDVPLVDLAVPSDGDPFAYVGRVATALRSRVEPAAALVMVQGDTASAYGGARAARLAGLPLAHVEAGLRSFDRRNPWPEEDFRIAIDRASDLLFAPTALARDRLREERLRGEIHVTGNSGVDAVLRELEMLGPEPPNDKYRRILVTCHRREHWGAPLDRIMGAIDRLSRRDLALIRVVMHPNPAVQARWRACLSDRENVTLDDPLSYRDMLTAMRDSHLILSDSGGMQEEAPYIGTPLFILREATERPEGIRTGQLKLVGTDPDTIFTEVEHFFRRRWVRARMRRRGRPYGTGKAGERIAQITGEWLDRRARERRAANDRGVQPLARPSGMLFR